MTIQVLIVLVSVLLKTCIKVLSEPIQCTKRHYFEYSYLFSCSHSLSLSLPPSLPLCIFILCVFYFYPAKPHVISVKLPHINLFMVLEREG